MTPYRLLPDVLLRTPMLSFKHYTGAVSDDLLSDPIYQAAIYFASPVFYRHLALKDFRIDRLNEKELFSLNKYYNRMSFRSTPFGLFAAVSPAKWGDGEQIRLISNRQLQVSVQADQEVLALIEKMIIQTDCGEDYSINPTLYRHGNSFRFIHSLQPEKGTRLTFSLDSLGMNGLTRKLIKRLRKSNRCRNSLVEFIQAETKCDTAAATDYFRYLNDSQVIRSANALNITGTDYLTRQGEKQGAMLPNSLFGGDMQPGAEMIGLAEGFLRGIKNSPEKPFYVNTMRKVVAGSLDKKYQNSILNAIGILGKLSTPASSPMLDKFIRDFKGRFEERRVPLMQAMDPDAGIGYGNLAEMSAGSKLLKDVSFPYPERIKNSLEWSAVHQMLLKKWHCLPPGGMILKLDPADLEALPGARHDHLPPSLSVLFKLAGDQVILESAGGVSATALIGRFTPLSVDIHRVSKDIVKQEIAANPGVLFAEIAQLSDHHTDNVNRRLTVYPYEIPVNSSSLLRQENQLRLDDLVISLRNDELILESVSLGKRIIPRLSSAFNYQHNKLAVFRFLCDLQYQSLHSGLSFDLERFFPGMNFYPRVEAGEVVLSPARWYFKADDLEKFKQGLNSNNATFHLPAMVALTKFDQQLVFDLTKKPDRELLSKCVAGEKEVMIQEYWLPSDQNQIVTDVEGSPYINQFIAFLVRDAMVYLPMAMVTRKQEGVARTFILGGEWLYLKIYCSALAADELLTGEIMPAINKLRKQFAFHWFFVRYSDTDHHIRLRIKADPANLPAIIANLHARFSALVKTDLVRNYQADTYRRELERYGPDRIGLVEDFFEASSELVLHYLKFNSDQRLPSELHLPAIGNMLLLLELMLPDPNEQVNFLEQMTASFLAEFKSGKDQRTGLDKLYRKLRPEISRAAGQYRTHDDRQIRAYLHKFILSAERLHQKCRGFDPHRVTKLLADLIHMHLNRLFPDRQRKQEMILYYCLLKHKISENARSGA